MIWQFNEARRKRCEHLVLASCWETSRRVFICSEITPTARKPAHARPAPSPNLLVKLEAIQSVLSTVAGLARFCCCTLAAGAGCSDEAVLSCGDGVGDCGCDGWFDEDGGGGGGGACCDEENWWVVVIGCERNVGDPKKVAILCLIKICDEINENILLESMRVFCSPPYPLYVIIKCKLEEWFPCLIHDNRWEILVQRAFY